MTPDGPRIAALEARVAALEAVEAGRAKGREKKRAQRERRAKGQRPFTVWANEDDLADKLVRGRFLDPLVTDQPDRVAEALQAAVDALEPEPVPRGHAR
jgi:hypothetical protein